MCPPQCQPVTGVRVSIVSIRKREAVSQRILHESHSPLLIHTLLPTGLKVGLQVRVR
jgi:hypothetical protein